MSDERDPCERLTAYEDEQTELDDWDQTASD